MKRTGIILVLAAILLLLSSSIVLAGTTTNGPHGAYTDNTDACGLCHSTHTGPTTNLISIPVDGTQNNTYEICIYCHNSTGSSKYDEVDGTIKDGSNTWASSAGGFQTMPTLEGPNSFATADSVAVTSKHIVDKTNGSLVNIPGGNQSTSDTAKIELTCSSCHDPHGTTNARQLRTSITVLSPDNTTYVTTSTDSVTATISNPLGKEKVVFNDQINVFCGACHTDYLNKNSSGSTQTGTYNTTLYRHKVGMPPGGAGTKNTRFDATYFALPLSSQGNVTCLTCHYGHGTTASVASSTYSGGSTLMRMDERGVCQNCHRMTPSQNQPTIVSASLAGQDKSKLIVNFDSYMYTTSDTANVSSVINPSNYTVTQNSSPIQIDTVLNPANGQFGITLQPNDSLGKTVVIPLQSIPATGSTVTVTVNNVKDLNGVAAANGTTFTFTP